MSKPVLSMAMSVALVVLGQSASLRAQADSTPTIGAFVFGNKGEAARRAEDIERNLRGFIHTTGLYQNVKLNDILDQGARTRAQAIDEARALLQQGKADYEQLDLEKAQSQFQKALKKLEYGYGYLRDASLLLETTLHLGATWVLVGEPEKASRVFMTAHGLPGPKVLDPNLFPPNIQDIFNQAMQSAENAPKGSVKLITAPLGARIYVNGSYRGVSPLTIRRLRSGHHLVRALKDGFRPWGGKIKVTPGKARSLKMKLKPTARHKTFAGHFRNMIGESFKGQPGPAAQSLAGFIKASYLAIVVVQGSPRALKLRGYHCEIGDSFKIASHQEVLDSSDRDFYEKLSGYFGALLATTPEAVEEAVAEATPVEPTGETTEETTGDTSSYESSEGEAAAAALLAKSEEEQGDQGSYGLDLEDQESKPEESSGEQVAAAEKPEDSAAEKARKEKALDESLRNAKREEKSNQEESTWGYLSSSWWFWTTVGVVVAGAATGTYFLLSSDEAEGGSLILGLH